MKKITRYLQYKSFMLQHMSFATENESLKDSLYHLVFYHWYKDAAQHEYWTMTHEQRKDLHTLMIL